MNAALTPRGPDEGAPTSETEDEEIERLADQIEAAWDKDPDADVKTIMRSSRPSLSNLPRSLPYWVAGGIAAIVLAIWPVVYTAYNVPVAGLVPLLLLLLAVAVFVVGAVRLPIQGSGWGARALGLIGLLLMTLFPVVLGLNGTLSGPTLSSPLAPLADVLSGVHPALWALGLLALYASWLMATRRPAVAYATVPVLGVGVLLLQWVLSLMGLLSPWGQAYNLARPALQFDWNWEIGPYESPFFWTGVEFFVISRVIEVAGVLLCLRLATVFEGRAVMAREAAAAQAAVRGDSAGSAPGSIVASAERTNTLAILSLIFVFVFPLIGVILGHVARSQIRRSGERGKGLTFAALIVGYLAIGALVLVVIVSAILRLAFS